jgi:hypothetical protein
MGYERRKYIYARGCEEGNVCGRIGASADQQLQCGGGETVQEEESVRCMHECIGRIMYVDGRQKKRNKPTEKDKTIQAKPLSRTAAPSPFNPPTVNKEDQSRTNQSHEDFRCHVNIQPMNDGV